MSEYATVVVVVNRGYEPPAALLEGPGASEWILSQGAALYEQRQKLAAAPETARLAAELSVARSALAAVAEETRRVVAAATAAASAAAASAAAEAAAAVPAELAALRAEMSSLQRGAADRILEVARETRREVEAEYRARLASAEAEHQARLASATDLAGLASRFDRVFSSQAAAQDKGRGGEAAMGATLLALFPEAELTDCAATPHGGDAVLTLVRGGRAVRIMIECKNRGRVQTEDLAKFERDCERGDIDAALFAALAADTIPRKGPQAFGAAGAAGEIPALYLAAALASPEALRLGVEALAFAALGWEKKSADRGSGWDDVATTVALAFGVLSRQSARVRALRESAAAVLAALEGCEGEAAIAAAAIEAMWAARPELRRTAPESAPPADPGAAARLRVQRFVSAHGRDPSREELGRECGIADSLIRRAGGARALIGQAKREAALLAC